MELRFIFDRIAGLYDAARAGYPAEAFDRLATFAAPGGSVLEVGCGTGKATVGLTARGLNVVALDPGPSMIAQARSNLGEEAKVRFVTATFEGWTPDAADFDLIAAAQAWHWVAPGIGLPKAASLLKPNGALAIFGNDWTLADPDVNAAVDAAYTRLAPELRDSPLGFWYRADGPLPPMIEGCGLYRDLFYEGFAWSRNRRYRDLSWHASDPVQSPGPGAAASGRLDERGRGGRARLRDDGRLVLHHPSPSLPSVLTRRRRR